MRVTGCSVLYVVTILSGLSQPVCYPFCKWGANKYSPKVRGLCTLQFMRPVYTFTQMFTHFSWTLHEYLAHRAPVLQRHVTHTLYTPLHPLTGNFHYAPSKLSLLFTLCFFPRHLHVHFTYIFRYTSYIPSHTLHRDLDIFLALSYTSSPKLHTQFTRSLHTHLCIFHS